MKKNYFTIGLLSGALFIVDQILKQVAITYYKIPVHVYLGFALRLEKNYGIALSIPVPYIALIVINICLLFLVPFFLAKELEIKNKISQVIISFIIAGALGNLFDRITLGYVIDYIAIGSFPVFNLADALLSIGIFLLFVFYGKIKRV